MSSFRFLLPVLVMVAISIGHGESSKGAQAQGIADIISKLNGDGALARPVIDEPSTSVGEEEKLELGSEDSDQTHHDRWMNSGKFQGDIAGIDPRYGVSGDGIQYNAIRNRQLRWPGGLVPYVFSSHYTSRERAVITTAMETYHKKTCIKFVPRTTESDYLAIVKSYGCYSQVGRVRGRQEISLGNGCLYHEIAVHELMHSLGFWHEHSRADRDQFINIQWENIISGMKGQFDKVSTAYQDFLGETYDYRSVMHYDSRAFSRNGRDTILTVQPGFTRVIGHAKDLSSIDLRKVNKLYQCDGRTSDVATPAPPRPRPAGPPPGVVRPSGGTCVDKFLDCPFFHRYCFRRSFFFIMKLYCPKTCNHCNDIRRTGAHWGVNHRRASLTSFSG